MATRSNSKLIADIRSLLDRLQQGEGEVDVEHLFPSLRRVDPKWSSRLVRFPNLQVLDRAIDVQLSVDFQAAGAERDAAIGELNRVSEKSDLEKVVLATLAYRDKKITPAAFHALLMSFIEIYQLGGDYSNLMSYTEYLTCMESLNLEQVVPELQSLCQELIQELGGDLS